jgi:hypothetical protein
MSVSRDEARTLELIIRAAVAEERLLARQLERAAEEQRRTRADLAREQESAEFWRNGNGKR